MAVHASLAERGEGSRGASILLRLVLSAVIGLPPLLFAFAAWQSYKQEAQALETEVNVTADVLREHLLRALDNAALALDQVLERTRALSPEQIEGSVEIHIYLARLNRAIGPSSVLWMSDAAGKGTASSLSFPPPPHDASEKDFFLEQKGRDAGVFVGVPYRPSVGTMDWAFALSRRRERPDGTFDGIVHVMLGVEYFSSFWSTVKEAQIYTVPLIRDDGELLVRYPAPVSGRFKLAANSPLMLAKSRAPDGIYTAVSQIDGRERISAYRDLGRYPLTISYSVETEATFAPWWRTIALYGGLAGLGWLVLIGVTLQALRHSRSEAEAFASLRQEVQRRIDTEARLQQSQKMEAVGQLTGGVAHDFNNLLTVILGNAEAITEQPQAAPETRRLAEQILQAAERGSDLNQKLLAFGRRQSLRPVPLKPDDVVLGLVGLLERTIGEHIDLRTVPCGGEARAIVDRTLLESALLNLAINARDAMPRGGVLTISTLEIPDAAGGVAAVEMVVSDTGSGMIPEVLERAFEPFFTTKEIGKGSGLGLSMVYGFAEQSGGRVSIESRVGAGTSVTIALPVVPAQPVEAAAARGAPDVVGRGERILVVEDEPSVLLFVTSHLLGLGYEVEAVSTGPDALDVLSRDRRFDLLFSDVVLPQGMSGVELAGKARALMPDLKVLLTSGYPEDAFEHHGRPDPDMLLLRKPYRRKELAETLRKVLERGQG